MFEVNGQSGWFIFLKIEKASEFLWRQDFGELFCGISREFLGMTGEDARHKAAEQVFGGEAKAFFLDPLLDGPES
jgi:hypothetical protein